MKTLATLNYPTLKKRTTPNAWTCPRSTAKNKNLNHVTKNHKFPPKNRHASTPWNMKGWNLIGKRLAQNSRKDNFKTLCSTVCLAKKAKIKEWRPSMKLSHHPLNQSLKAHEGRPKGKLHRDRQCKRTKGRVGEEEMEKRVIRSFHLKINAFHICQ